MRKILSTQSSVSSPYVLDLVPMVGLKKNRARLNLYHSNTYSHLAWMPGYLEYCQ